MEITITYDQLIEGGFLRFNVVPANTVIAYISHLAAKNNQYVKLSSGKTGVGFYNYDE